MGRRAVLTECLVSKSCEVDGSIGKSSNAGSNDGAAVTFFLGRGDVRCIRIKEERVCMVSKSSKGIDCKRVSVDSLLLTVRKDGRVFSKLSVKRNVMHPERRSAVRCCGWIDIALDRGDG